MKLYPISAVLGILLLISCTDGNNSPAPIQRITEIGVFDVGNDGGATDIRVVFNIENVAQINEFSLLVIPSGLSASFTKEQALLLTEERYRTISLGNSEDYSVRLSDIRDVEGNPIVESKAYVVRVLMRGDQFNQLSMIESNGLTLANKGIYNGYYEGALTHNISGLNITSFIRIITLSGTFTESSVSAGRYIGQFTTVTQSGSQFNPGTTGSTSISISMESDGTISQFEVSGSLAPFSSVYVDCKQANTGVFKGAIKRESVLEINGEDCQPGLFEILLERSRWPG